MCATSATVVVIFFQICCPWQSVHPHMAHSGLDLAAGGKQVSFWVLLSPCFQELLLIILPYLFPTPACCQDWTWIFLLLHDASIGGFSTLQDGQGWIPAWAKLRAWSSHLPSQLLKLSVSGFPANQISNHIPEMYVCIAHSQVLAFNAVNNSFSSQCQCWWDFGSALALSSRSLCDAAVFCNLLPRNHSHQQLCTLMWLVALKDKKNLYFILSPWHLRSHMQAGSNVSCL
jgi:hypothetical protein